MPSILQPRDDISKDPRTALGPMAIRLRPCGTGAQGTGTLLSLKLRLEGYDHVATSIHLGGNTIAKVRVTHRRADEIQQENTRFCIQLCWNQRKEIN